jgi:hypothetical protein
MAYKKYDLVVEAGMCAEYVQYRKVPDAKAQEK